MPAVRAAAVAGRVAERRLLVTVAGYPGNQVLDALNAACRARLPEEDHAAYRFAHDIVREVVEGDLSATRCAALHQRTAEALEALSDAPPVTLLAYHYAQSDAVDMAILYLEQAGDPVRAGNKLARFPLGSPPTAHFRSTMPGSLTMS
jgi:hypothetical protein